MSTIGEEYDIENDSEIQDDPAEFYGARDSTLFLIDTSSEMFNNNEEGKPFFVKCIEVSIVFWDIMWSLQLKTYLHSFDKSLRLILSYSIYLGIYLCSETKITLEQTRLDGFNTYWYRNMWWRYKNR